MTILTALLLCFGQQVPPPSMIPPPATAYPWQATLIIPEMDMRGVVNVLTEDKQIEIQWAYTWSGAVAHHTERFDLSFWPTAVAAVDEDELVVAGKKPSNGKTIFYRITLRLTDWPRADHATDTSESVLTIETASVPKALLPFGGSANQVLVLRRDGSIDLLNYVDGTGTSLYSTGAHQMLALDQVDRGFSAEHASWGFVYLFYCDHSTWDEGGVVLKDLDRNGTIDSVEEVATKEQWKPLRQEQWIRLL